MPLQRPAKYLILFIVVTIPLIFGAVHPIVEGFYLTLVLIGCGGWLLLTSPEMRLSLPSFWVLVPLLTIFWIIIQSVPLPLPIVEMLTPQRAERIAMVNELASTTIAWTSISDNGITSFYRAIVLFSLLLLFGAISRLLDADPTFFKTIVFCMIAVGAFEAAYGILQFLKPQLGILWLELTAGRAAYGTIIYKNQYASLLNMIWPLALTGGVLYLIVPASGSRSGGVQFRTSRAQAPLLIFAAGLMIIAVLFSLSRGGIVTMAVVALLLALLLPFSTKGKLRFVVFFCVLVCGYVLMLGIDTVITRFNTISISGETRIDVYRYTISLVADHWLTGIGLGSFSLLSPVYLKGFPENLQYDRVHSEYLELLVELGIPAATLLFCWIAAGLIKLLIRQRRAITERKDLVAVALAAACWCGLAGLLFHGIADFGWRLPANLVYATVLLALVLHCLRNAETGETGNRPRFRPIDQPGSVR